MTDANKKTYIFSSFLANFVTCKNPDTYGIYKPKENTLNLLFEFIYQCVSKNVDQVYDPFE